MLKAIYTTGSSLILENANDKDVVRYYETKEECIEAVKKHKRDKNLDEHFDYVGHVRAFLGCYIYHYMELIEGEDLHLSEFSIFDENNKKDYVACLKRFINWLPLENKWWYHILTACYLYKNGDYRLTKTQINAIQKVHDEGATKKVKDFCISELNTLE